MDARLLARILVTDRSLVPPEMSFVDCVAESAQRYGATLIMLREKDLEDDRLLALARALVRAAPVPVVLSHRPDLAARANVAGVHLGWNSPAVVVARNQLGPGALVGISVHGAEEAQERSAEEPDYVVLGPIRETPSKRELVQPLGFACLARAAAACPLPVVGIGGLGPEYEDDVRLTGAAGWAAIRAFLAGPSEDPS